MPGRVLNLNMLIIGPLLIGLFAAWRRTRPGLGGVLLLILCAALVVGNRSGLWTFDGGHRALAAAVPPVMRPNATNVVLIAVLLAIAVAWIGRRLRTSGRGRPAHLRWRRSSSWRTALVRLEPDRGRAVSR